MSRIHRGLKFYNGNRVGVSHHTPFAITEAYLSAMEQRSITAYAIVDRLDMPRLSDGRRVPSIFD